MGINNAGTTSIYAGLHTQNSTSICHGIDVFTGGSPTPPSNGYVAEDGTTYYVAEDGTTYYVQE